VSTVRTASRIAGLAIVVLAAVAAVLARGLLQAEFLAPVERDHASAPAPLEGSLVDARDRQLRAAAPPDATAVLTFEDGPDPAWTPAILDVLAAQDVKATFFVVGAAVTEHPDLVRRIVAAGHDLGLHGFTHSDLAGMPAARARLELSLTQRAVIGATGMRTAVARPPFAATRRGLVEADTAAMRTLGGLGYLTVLSDLEADDARHASTEAVLREARPTDGKGAVIQLHDGGGDRRHTLAALPPLIEGLRDDGYRFATVSEAIGGAALTHAADGADIVRGRALLTAMRIGGGLINLILLVLIPATGLLLVRSLIVVVLARRHVREVRTRPPAPTGFTPSVSVIVPAYNEAVGIVAAVRSLAASDYPDFEVIVVDDGSTDGTAGLVDELGLPNVKVIRQANAGKPAALNTGTAAARGQLIAMVDADTVFEPATLRRLVAPFSDPRVGGVSGNTKVGNRDRLLGRWQHIEYVMGFNLDRRAYDVLGCMPTVPGAIGAFRRQVLAAVGGVSGDTLAEDTDLTMAVVRAGWRVVYAEDAIAWTEAPSNLRDLWRQRYRWGYGTMQSMWKHRAAFRGGGNLGRVTLPYLLVFQVLLPLLAPIVDLLAIYGLVLADPLPVIAYWAAFNAVQVALAYYAFRLDRESVRPLWASLFAQIVYRQLLYAVVFASVAAAVGGKPLRWHRLERVGLDGHLGEEAPPALVGAEPAA
jgi:cellulose synthase/poly-beta-1,6-N-acetylglucosamine synthase-like glycosyltransferase/peptidoglycan/xylan/chitin deacetylase (PgdA/CDA1 family)